MTDRFHSLTVALSGDSREDDAEALMNAIRLLRGVLDVAGNVSDAGAWTAERRAMRVIEQRLWDALNTDRESDDATR